jgi:hypothetical protein
MPARAGRPAAPTAPRREQAFQGRGAARLRGRRKSLCRALHHATFFGTMSLAITSPNGPVMRMLAALLAFAEQREHQLREAVRLFQVRIAGQDERLDAEVLVLAHARGHRLRDRPPAPCRRRRAPGPRRPTGWATLPACRAGRRAAPPCGCWPTESIFANAACALAMVVVQVADEFIGGAPGFLVRLAHDHVQADAEFHRAAVFCGARADVGQLLGHGRRRLAPGQVHVHLLGRQFVRRFRRAAEVQRRIRLLHGGYSVRAPFTGQVLALEIESRPSPPSPASAARQMRMNSSEIS